MPTTESLNNFKGFEIDMNNRLMLQRLLLAWALATLGLARGRETLLESMFNEYEQLHIIAYVIKQLFLVINYQYAFSKPRLGSGHDRCYCLECDYKYTQFLLCFASHHNSTSSIFPVSTVEIVLTPSASTPVQNA